MSGICGDESWQFWIGLAMARLMTNGWTGYVHFMCVENLNLMTMENIKEFEKERKRMEVRVFKWFGYVSLRPHDVANGLHLY